MRGLRSGFWVGNVLGALVATPLLSAYGRRWRHPAPPASDTEERQEKDKSSAIDDASFWPAIRAAYATIYDRNDYAAAIPAAEIARP